VIIRYGPDGPAGHPALPPGTRHSGRQAAAVRKTIPANRARAASTIREPTITTIPFRPVSTSATPTGSTDGANDAPGGLDDRKRAGACRRHDPIMEPDQEHQHEAEKIKMGVGRRQGEILAHPHDDPEYESAQ